MKKFCTAHEGLQPQLVEAGINKHFSSRRVICALCARSFEYSTGRIVKVWPGGGEIDNGARIFRVHGALPPSIEVGDTVTFELQYSSEGVFAKNINA